MNRAPTTAQPEQGRPTKIDEQHSVVAHFSDELKKRREELIQEILDQIDAGDVDAEDVRGWLKEGDFQSFEAGLAGMTTPEIGFALMQSLRGQAYGPNTTLAPNTHRAVVSKYSVRLRKNLGLPIEFPGKQKAGRMTKPHKPKTDFRAD